MRRKFNQVYQFKITLKDIQPLIWRQIQVPETYSFWDLHVAIQDAMGWSDSHLHEFRMIDSATGRKASIGIPDEEKFLHDNMLKDWEQKITNYFSMENRTADYIYDFGDSWEHIIELGKIQPREIGVKYPRCLAGERACPPEDCGGIPGYFDFLEAIKSPTHARHEETIRWIGGEFNPEYFDKTKAKFHDPKKRLKTAFG